MFGAIQRLAFGAETCHVINAGPNVSDSQRDFACKVSSFVFNIGTLVPGCEGTELYHVPCLPGQEAGDAFGAVIELPNFCLTAYKLYI